MAIADDGNIAHAHRADTWNHSQLLFQLLVERHHLHIAVPGARRVQAKKKDVVGSESERCVTEISQRAHEKTRTNEQDGRKSDLENYQRFTKPHPVSARGTVIRVVQRIVSIGACRLPRGNDAEEDARRQRKSGGEGQHPPIKIDLRHGRVRWSCEQPRDHIAPQVTQHQAGDSADGGKQQAFGEHLSQDVHPARSQREPRAHLTLPGGGAR